MINNELMKVMNNTIEQKVLDLTTNEGANAAFDVLTPYALQQIEKEVAYNEKSVTNTYQSANLLVQKLEEYGFVEGEHFTQNISIIDVTYSTTVYTSDDKDFEKIDVTIPWKRCINDVMLITMNDRASSGQLEKNLVPVRYKKDWKLGDTFECPAITKQYRYYKASGFLQHLLDHRQMVTNRYEGKQRQLGIVAKGFEVLSERYPNAKVEVVQHWSRTYRTSSPVLRIVFASNSYVVLSVYTDGTEGDVRFSELERWDSQRESLYQLMDRLDSQEAKK